MHDRPPPPVDAEALLAHVGWVRALALRLVHEESDADDVVQDTFAAAIARPPRAHVPLGPWLARVARNFSRRLVRSASRRRRREVARALAAPRPSLEESALRTERFHALVGAVLGLEPIYRDVVILRFFEELDGRAAGERLGVPFETAKTRLRRALALLRERLDADHGGRAAWATAFLPLAEVSRAAAGTSSASMGTGGLVMATSAKTFAGVGVACALVGAVAGVAVAPHLGFLESRTPVERGDSASLEARAPETTTRDVAGTPTRLEGVVARGDGGAATASGRAIAALLADEEIVLPRRVPGVVTGTVRTQDGTPVPNVVIRTWSPEPWPAVEWRGQVPPAPTAEELIRKAVRSAKWVVATRLETRTDAEGAFRLGDLLDLDYHVMPFSRDHEFHSLGRSGGKARAGGGSVDYVASLLAAVSLAVVLPDGTEPDEAWVRWSDPDRGGGSVTTWRKGQRTILINPGTWSLTAEVGSDTSSKPVSVTTGAEAGLVTLRLEARSILRGTVRLDPADVAWKMTWLMARRRAADPPTRALRANPQPPSWDYRFEDVEPGEYEITVGLDDGAPVTTTVVHVTAGAVTQDIVLPRLTATHVLEARVLGPGGEPVGRDDVSFTIFERETNNSARGAGARYTQRSDGTFLVGVKSPWAEHRERMREERARGAAVAGGPPLPPEDADPKGPFRTSLRVQLKAGGHQEVEFVPGETTRVEVSFR